MNKAPLFTSIACFITYRLLLFITENSWLSLSVFLLPIGLLAFNLSVRKRLSFSAWFLSSRNFFLERTTLTSESDLDPDLLFAKLLEVIDDSHFQLLETNENRLQLLLGTSVNFWTWGENVYLQIIPAAKGSIIQFTSVTLFGTSSWKQNDANLVSFIHSFEQSFII